MKTIKSKLLLALILPTVIVAVFPIIIFIASNNHHVKNTAYRSASAIIEDTTANFDTWLEGKKKLLNSYQKLDIGFLKPFLQSRATVEAEKLFSLYYGDTDGNNSCKDNPRSRGSKGGCKSSSSVTLSN